MADETTAAPRSRRALLTGGRRWRRRRSRRLGRTAADGVSAADPDDVVKGVDNATTATTSITNTHRRQHGLRGRRGRHRLRCPGHAARAEPASSAGASRHPGTASSPVTAPTPASSAGSPPDPIDRRSRRRRRRATATTSGVFGTRRPPASTATAAYGVVGEGAVTAAGVLALASTATALALDVQWQGQVQPIGSKPPSARAQSDQGHPSPASPPAARSSPSCTAIAAAGASGPSWPPRATVQDLPQRLGVVVDVHGLVRARLTMKDPRTARRTRVRRSPAPPSIDRLRAAVAAASPIGIAPLTRRRDWSRTSTRSSAGRPTVSPAKARAGSPKASPPGTFGLPD